AAYGAAEAIDAQHRAEQEAARARHAELSAQLDRLDRFVEEQREQERRAWHQDHDRRQQLMERLRAVAEEPRPQVRSSPAELRQRLDALDRYVDRAVLVERDKDRAYIDRCESRARWDWAFAARWRITHPGGISGCTCPSHRAYRGEDV